MMLRSLCFALAVLTACVAQPPTPTPGIVPTAGAPAAATPDAAGLLSASFPNLRRVTTLRMDVQRSGAPYMIDTDYGAIEFRDAAAQFVAPDMLQAAAGAGVLGLPAQIDIFARGERQWFRNILLTANDWRPLSLASDFNPQQLMATESGFQYALDALAGLTWRGQVALEAGVAAHHLAGWAPGEGISALLLNLVQFDGEVRVELWLDEERMLPLRFRIEQPSSVAGAESTVWEVALHDFNGASGLEAPAGVLP